MCRLIKKQARKRPIQIQAFCRSSLVSPTYLMFVIMTVGCVANAGVRTVGVTDQNVKIQRPLLLPQEGHAFEVVATAISPDGRFVATGSSDGIVILWETATG